jgi:blue copper oxidase
MVLSCNFIASFYFRMLRFLFIFLPFLGFAQNALFIPDTISGSSISLAIQEGQVNFYGTTPTQTYGINGNILAPTILLNRGQQVSMEVQNDLQDSTTIHWHGLHVPAEDDGGPHTPILPGTLWNPQFEVMDWASTYWYHPHLHHKTNQHVQKGLAGIIIIRDAEEQSLNLPRKYGVDDIPLILQTKGFDVNKQIVVETALDTAVMVNATLDAFQNLPAQVVRLRVLNGASERVFNIGLSNNQVFYLIGTDGGLLSAPVSLTRLQLAPGERAELLIDLQGMIGQTLYLKSFGSELPNGVYGANQPGMGAGQSIPNYSLNPLNGSDFNLLQLNVVAPTASAVNSIPTALVAHTPWQEALADAQRTVTFSPVNMGPTAINGPFVFDMMPFDMMMVNHTIPLDNVEVWTLQNNTPIAHPFHIHDVPFYILDINGTPPAPALQGRKDVVLVPGGMGTVRIITKFEDFANPDVPFMYHCHMLTHEDGGMMGQFLVVDPNVGLPLETIESSVEVYPNPFSEAFTITLPFATVGQEISIVQVDGKELHNLIIEASTISIAMDGFNTGTYFLKNQDGIVLKRLIKF